MALYVSREGPQATVNAFANLTTFGGQTLNAVQVPEGYNSIKELWVSAFPDGNANDTLGCVFMVRLTGPAIKNGPVDLVVGGWGNEQTGNDSEAVTVYSQVIPVDIALKSNATFWIQFAQFGGSTTVGAPECGVTCVLTQESVSDVYYIVRNISDAGTANTRFAMTTSAEDTAAAQVKVPPGCSRITKIMGASGGIPLATTVGATTGVLIEGNGLADGGSVRLPISGDSQLSTGTGVSSLFMQATVIPTDISVKKGGELFLYAEHSTDYGTPYTAVGLEFR